MLINLSMMGKENNNSSNAPLKVRGSAFLDKIKLAGVAARPSQSRNDAYERPQTQGSITAARVSLKPQIDKSMLTYESSSTITRQTTM